MGYTFDFIVGYMKCPRCGCISEADSSTNMQTKICDEANMESYGVGAKLELYHGKIEDCGFFCLVEPVCPDSFSMVDMWTCNNCDHYNFALIIIKDSVIESVKEIIIDEKKAKEINCITVDSDFLGWIYLNGEMVRSW